MSTAVSVLVLLAAVPHLILGGAGVDRLLVQIPAWYRIGPVAFARYARVADLGNGRVLYPLLGSPVTVFSWGRWWGAPRTDLRAASQGSRPIGAPGRPAPPAVW